MLIGTDNTGISEMGRLREEAGLVILEPSQQVPNLG